MWTDREVIDLLKKIEAQLVHFIGVDEDVAKIVMGAVVEEIMRREKRTSKVTSGLRVIKGGKS